MGLLTVPAMAPSPGGVWGGAAPRARWGLRGPRGAQSRGHRSGRGKVTVCPGRLKKQVMLEYYRDEGNTSSPSATAVIRETRGLSEERGE